MSSTASESTTTRATELVRRLHEPGPRLDPELRREVLGQGSGAASALVEILEADIKEPADSLASAHATELLGELGAECAIEPMLRLLAASDPLDVVHDALMRVLGRLGAGACNLAIYKDPRALPHLSAAFDACELEDKPSILGNQRMVELKAAIEDLGGTLTEAQEAKYEGAISARDEWRRAMGAAVEGERDVLVQPVVASFAMNGGGDRQAVRWPHGG